MEQLRRRAYQRVYVTGRHFRLDVGKLQIETTAWGMGLLPRRNCRLLALEADDRYQGMLFPDTE